MPQTAGRLRVALDCDGVVLDSNEMKSAIFADILEGYDPEPTERFLAHQKRSFGSSRYKLFDTFFADFLKRDAEAGEKDRLLDIFAERCRGDYQAQPFTDGAVDAIRRLVDGGVAMAIVSASAQEELRGVLSQMGVASLFEIGIFGSPQTKVEHLTALTRASTDPLLFVGDGVADWRAAKEVGVPFLGMATWSSDKSGIIEACASNGSRMIANLGELADLVLEQGLFDTLHV